MPKHELKVSLAQMRDHALEAVTLAKDRSRQDLDSDRMLNLSLVRLLEVIGEAANRVSRQDRARYPSVPWSQVIALRNRLIHAYDEVDLDIVWKIVMDDLPLLLDELNAILNTFGLSD